jgi:hypothetical protein
MDGAARQNDTAISFWDFPRANTVVDARLANVPWADIVAFGAWMLGKSKY